MTSPKVPWWVWASIALSACLSLWSLTFRYRVEQRNRAVSLCAELEIVEQLGAAEGMQLSEALDALRRSGLNGIVMSERTLGELADAGFVQIAPASMANDSTSAQRWLVVRGQGPWEGTIFDWLSIRFPGATVDVSEPNAQTALLSGIGIEEARSVSFGLDPASTAALRQRGFLVVARFTNPVGISDSGVRRLIEHAGRVGAGVFLPMGDQVLGRREGTKALVEALRKNGLLYASPEFAKIGGDANVLGQAPDIVVRLHSAQTAELDRMPLPDAVERYARAASERNQRVLLLRPLSFSGERPAGDFARFVGAVRDQLRREGLDVRPVRPFEDPAPPKWLFPAIGLAAAPAVFFAAIAFLPWTWSQGVAGLVVVLLSAGAAHASVKPFTALACATAFPTLAFLIVGAAPNRRPWMSYIVVSLVSLTGGLCVAGLLNGLPYLVKADQFMGVKLAHFSPVALVGAWLLFRTTNAKNAFRCPMTWTHAAVASLIAVGLALMFLRTGNENPSAVSDVELRLRSLLDELLFVRPRTKEFLVGHPATIVGLCLLARSASWAAQARTAPFAGWGVLALTLGAIGQTSIVNTLCHLHTPLAVGLVRIGVGLAVGGLVGAFVWTAVKRFLPKEDG